MAKLARPLKPFRNESRSCCKKEFPALWKSSRQQRVDGNFPKLFTGSLSPPKFPSLDKWWRLLAFCVHEKQYPSRFSGKTIFSSALKCFEVFISREFSAVLWNLRKNHVEWLIRSKCSHENLSSKEKWRKAFSPKKSKLEKLSNFSGDS